MRSSTHRQRADRPTPATGLLAAIVADRGPAFSPTSTELFRLFTRCTGNDGFHRLGGLGETDVKAGGPVRGTRPAARSS
jgi:hypothetical protein